ncbi:alkyl sulfatase BDS1-like metallo-beta-lactamase superfamily hydrolase [Winogradskyella wandonensis]|uniref:Alkyl sulfatase BDS1-like metallo-beta-lactamase superfamily hydrolase n=1 Tax=Winogradskyella wandonensis TaxID=1442586 RepID=A0A4R1KXG8_9FLAO|nr:alkyl sulfatase dimerization domain-containing protein [Winogradskyella wandonensis]TCK68989.1 alkyl sulfatase BDS1-like metallo-beta-lactamase superfamily hydrolase [Winogradskyella wandonensis]
MKKITYLVVALVLLGCQNNQSFDSNLLNPEVIDHNVPLKVEPYADENILKNLAPIRARFDNFAITEDSEFINDRMTSFGKQMPKTIYEPVKDKAFLMSGWQLTSTLIVVGDVGLIVVDPGESDEASERILNDFRKETNIQLPVKAVVYTHRHPDHSFGSAGMGVTQEQVDNGEVKIFAHHQFMEYLANDASVVGSILTERTAYGGATYLGQNEKGLVHAGLGPTFAGGKISFYSPTDIVKGELKADVAGVKMVLFEAYGDAEDEIDVYFPELRHVHGSETIQGESFPNLYTLRGTKYRDLVKWYKGVDNLLDYAKKSDSYSHSHMRSWVGNDFIVERIQNYRDAIQFTHDQSIYHMNQGATREELVGLVSLPEHLKKDPWLQEFYGSVEHVVRNVYNGYLGWYSGDATELATPSFKRKANLYISAMGGRDNVLNIANKAYEAKDYGWAMEVTTHLVRSNPEDQEARDLKGKAMQAWGYDQANIYYRNFALSGAKELDGTLDKSGAFDFANPVIIQQFGIGTILENLRVKIDASKAVNADFKIGFNITDRNEKYGFHVRNGIAAFYRYIPDNSDLVIDIPSHVVYDFVLGKGRVKDAISKGEGTANGDVNQLDTFMSFFDFKKADINLSSR